MVGVAAYDEDAVDFDQMTVEEMAEREQELSAAWAARQRENDEEEAVAEAPPAAGGGVNEREGDRNKFGSDLALDNDSKSLAQVRKVDRERKRRAKERTPQP